MSYFLNTFHSLWVSTDDNDRSDDNHTNFNNDHGNYNGKNDGSPPDNAAPFSLWNTSGGVFQQPWDRRGSQRTISSVAWMWKKVQVLKNVCGKECHSRGITRQRAVFFNVKLSELVTTEELQGKEPNETFPLFANHSLLCYLNVDVLQTVVNIQQFCCYPSLTL